MRLLLRTADQSKIMNLQNTPEKDQRKMLKDTQVKRSSLINRCEMVMVAAAVTSWCTLRLHGCACLHFSSRQGLAEENQRIGHPWVDLEPSV
jgi:hypothetical protein